MLAKNVYEVAGAPQASAAPTAAAPAGPEPIEPLLASASVDAGKGDMKLCTACHTFDKGGPNRVGPNLYGIVGDEIAHARGNYDFSAALKQAGGGKTWTPDLAQRVAVQAAELRQGHQDDLRRRAQGEGPRRHHRLSQFAERRAEAARRQVAAPMARAGAQTVAPEHLALAHALADAAGAVARRYFRQAIAIDDKPDLTPVTIADREAEAAMRRLIEERFPDHGIIGEEHGRAREDAEFVWVLDPDRRHQELHQRHPVVRHARSR